MNQGYYIRSTKSLETPTRHCSVGSGASQNIHFKKTSEFGIKNIYLYIYLFYNSNFKKTSTKIKNLVQKDYDI